MYTHRVHTYFYCRYTEHVRTYVKKVKEEFKKGLEAIFISSGQWTNSYRFALLARLEELHSASGLVPYFAFWDAKRG
jgi:hypothetical protein